MDSLIHKFLPPRTKLISLEPIGIGSAQVESLSSYIIRLAHIHSISVRKLIIDVYSDSLNSQIFRKRRINFLSGTCSLNSVNSGRTISNHHIQAVEKLNGVKKLEQLTFATFSNQNITHRYSRKTKRWCSLCLHTDLIPYDRLLWNLRGYNVCPIHNEKLQSVCPTCRKEQLPLSGKAKICECSYCGSSLISSSETSDVRSSWPENQLEFSAEVFKLCERVQKNHDDKPHNLKSKMISISKALSLNTLSELFKKVSIVGCYFYSLNEIIPLNLAYVLSRAGGVSLTDFLFQKNLLLNPEKSKLVQFTDLE